MEQEFEDQSHVLTVRRNDHAVKRAAIYVWDSLYSFRGVRISGLLLLVILFACAFYGIENTYGSNLIDQNSLNSTSNSSITPIPGLTAQLNGLAFVDALFISVSLVSSTGLATIDFSQWTLASQIIAMFEMWLGSLLISSSIPVLAMIILARHRGGPGVTKLPEYRGLVLVLIMIYFYYFLFMIVMGTLFAIYCANATDIWPVFLSASPSLNPWYGGFFMALTAFSNCGFSVFTNSAVYFVTSPGWQIWICIFMLTGNVAFPLLLRSLLHLMRFLGMEKRFDLPLSKVLDNPRAYYNMLFPLKYLLFLSLLWIAMYVISFAICLGLEWNNTMTGLDDGQKVVAAIFTSVTSRTTGLNVLNTGGFKAALLVFEVVVFVVSSNPNAITMRATSNAAGTRTVSQYTKELLINVVAGLTLCWIVILLLENSNPFAGVFPVLFEVASAFGTVGLSMGFGSSPTSLCGCFSIPSKLLIMILMLVGCHRTLPANVDPFVEVLSRHATRDTEMTTGLGRSQDN